MELFGPGCVLLSCIAIIIHLSFFNAPTIINGQGPTAEQLQAQIDDINIRMNGVVNALGKSKSDGHWQSYFTFLIP